MKAKIACFLLSLFLLSGTAFSADFSNDGLILSPGDLVVNAGIGTGLAVGIDVPFSPRVAYMIGVSYTFSETLSVYLENFHNDSVYLGVKYNL